MGTHWVEGLPRVDGIHDEHSLAVAVVVLGDRFVFVLARSIPNLQFDPISVEADDFEDVVYADGHHVVIYELPLAVAEQQIALADSRVSDYYHLLEVVEGFVRFASRFPKWLHQYYTRQRAEICFVSYLR